MPESRKKKLLCVIWILAAVFLITGGIWNRLSGSIPEYVRVCASKEEALTLPAACSVSASDQNVLLQRGENGVQIYAGKTGTYQLGVRLFGFWKLDDITLEVVDQEYLVPGGMPVGIYLKSDGVMVIGTADVSDINGLTVNPAEGKIEPGDYILAVNGKNVSGKEELLQFIAENGGKDDILTIRRNESVSQVKLTPVNTAPGEYRLGLWVRSDLQGIGTLTYMDQKGNFGALGHGISDIDTGEVVNSCDGTLYAAQIHGVTKSTFGKPGCLSGSIRYEEDLEYGKIVKNTSQGIFGKISENYQKEYQQEAVPVAGKQQVHTGTAYIRSWLSGKQEDYEVQITNLNMSDHNQNKGLVLEVTDPRLLELTGGIVQGMSGSPILQDGKFVGAVTHVFVQDSTKGYGIFIEDMLRMQDKS